MDSTRHRPHEQRSHLGMRQDAPEHTASPMWSTSSLAEVNLPPQSAQPAASTRQRSPVLPPLPDAYPPITEPVEPAITTPLPYEAPSTVPVLSARHAASETNTRPDDPSTLWPADQNAAATDSAPYYDIIYDGGYNDDDGDDDDDLALDIPDTISRPLFPRGDAFTMSERGFNLWGYLRKAALLMLAVTLMVAVGIGGGALAATFSGQAARQVPLTPSRPTVSHTSSGIVIQPVTDAGTPTPTLPKYQIGAWPSDNAPSGGSVEIFVRISESVAPVANIPVMLTVELPGATQHYGPVMTDGYGLATFTVVYGGVGGVPVFVTATAMISPTGTPVTGTPIVETPTTGDSAAGTPTPGTVTAETVFFPL